MERLDHAADKHGLAPLLQTVRVSSTIYCRSEFSAPWGFAVQARSMASFHLVIRGDCWLEVDAQPQAIRLAAGDLVILPTGRSHQLRDNPASAVSLLDDLLVEHPPQRGRLRVGGPGPVADIACGGFALEGQSSSPLLAALPPVLHIAGEQGKPQPWVSSLFQLLQDELALPGSGSDVVIARLSDALLARALRTALAAGEPGPGLRPLAEDGVITRALGLVHERLNVMPRVDDLAATVGLSRSAFIARFRSATGESPRRYLTLWRLSQAARRLQAGEPNLSSLAHAIGYESEAAFSRAFKRHFQVPPGEYRKLARSS